MIEVMASLFGHVHPSNAKRSLFHDRNRFIIESMVSGYSFEQMLLRVVANGSTRSLRNALYDRHSSRFDIVFV